MAINVDMASTDHEAAIRQLLTSSNPDNTDFVTAHEQAVNNFTGDEAPSTLASLSARQLAQLNRQTIRQHLAIANLLDVCTGFIHTHATVGMAEKAILPAIENGTHMSTALRQEDEIDGTEPNHRDTYPEVMLGMLDTMGGLHITQTQEAETRYPRIKALTRLAIMRSNELHQRLWQIADSRGTKPPGRLGGFRPKPIDSPNIDRAMKRSRYINAAAGWSVLVAASYGVEEDLGPKASPDTVAATLLANADVLGSFASTTLLANPYRELPDSDTFDNVMSRISGPGRMHLTAGRLSSGASINQAGKCPMKHVLNTPELSEHVKSFYQALGDMHGVAIRRPEPPFIHPANLYMTMQVALGANHGIVGRVHEIATLHRAQN